MLFKNCVRAPAPHTAYYLLATSACSLPEQASNAHSKLQLCNMPSTHSFGTQPEDWQLPLTTQRMMTKWMRSFKAAACARKTNRIYKARQFLLVAAGSGHPPVNLMTKCWHAHVSLSCQTQSFCVVISPMQKWTA
eukprot:1161659-Pelagomonas_calceolata.AAC.6